MSIITRSCVLFLWIHTVSVKSQDCLLADFRRSDRYDSNFDISDLEDTYPSGKHVKVSCTIGFSGFFKLICEKGIWSHRGSKCEPRSCGHPGDAQFADFHLEQGEDFVFGSQVVYTCHEGYHMVSRKNYRRCMAQGWDGVVPVCEAQRCPVIHVEQGVQVLGDTEEANYRDVLRFSCKSNNEILIGSVEISCLENGQWSSQAPKCEEVRCKPPLIQNGVVHITRDYKENEFLEFSCDINYEPVGQTRSKCVKGRNKSEWIPAPMCEEVKCELVTTLPGTTYNPSFRNRFSPGDRLTVTCGEGYYIKTPQDTSAEAVCESNGKWNFDPVCQEVTCRNYRDRYVSWWSSRSWWQKITLGYTRDYQCVGGYEKPAGTTRLTCTRDGWSPNPPCVPEIRCNLQHFRDADVDRSKSYYQSRYRYNDKVEYICKNGYEGRFTLTCKENGWITDSRCTVIGSSPGTEPEQLPPLSDDNCEQGGRGHNCPDIIECPKAKVLNGFAVKSNGELYYACDDGYKLDPNPNPKTWWSRAECNKGKWTDLKQCINNSTCGEIPVIPNMKSHQPLNGQIIQIICKDGYHANVLNLTCNNGNWDSNGLALENICTADAKQCGPPPKVENALVEMSYQKEYLSGSEVTYKCRNNYTQEGNNKIRCNGQDGQWDPVEVTCTLYCGLPEDETITLITGDRQRFRTGDAIEFECVVPGKKQGGSITCANGKWSTPEGCKDTCTVDPVANGVSIEHRQGAELQKGTKITFSCRQRSHEIQGMAEVECLANGQWSHPFPTCAVPVHCGRAPPLENGDIKLTPKSRYNHNERVEYVCQRYHALRGGPHKTCFNGKWIGEMRCIKPCVVNERLMRENNIAFKFTYDRKQYITSGDVTEFMCTRGQLRSTVGLRQYCDDGVIHVPTCG